MDMLVAGKEHLFSASNKWPLDRFEIRPHLCNQTYASVVPFHRNETGLSTTLLSFVNNKQQTTFTTTNLNVNIVQKRANLTYSSRKPTDMTPPPQTLRILCFGNSLTAGFSQWGMEYFPYANHLPGPLQKQSPSTTISIDVAALSGDKVTGPTGQYLRRLESRCTKARAAPYDWIIIMGGTNDLGWGVAAEEIYEGLSIFNTLISYM